MKIVYEDFILETEPISGRFDVLRQKSKIAKEGDIAVKAGKKKVGEAYKSNEIIGYGMTIDRAMEKIIMLKIHAKKATTDLRGFLREYKKLKEELEIALNL